MAERQSKPASAVSLSVSSSQEYVKPFEDPYSKAISYLEKHNILQLFQTLTTDVIYDKPSDPLDYLIKEVQQIKQQKEKRQEN
ncbi:unnamed protein product [Lymnaea stagnalis]|uniref:Uncharacterized protein n=1 Tax=Lymnaea stagnalis TaxID=6523 RepID=A0AAV2I465_LYMST